MSNFRLKTAEAKFIESLIDGGFAANQADQIFDFYKKENLVKFDYANQRYTVKHGGLLDKAVLKRALKTIDEGVAKCSPKK